MTKKALITGIKAFIDDGDPPERWLDVLRAVGGLSPAFAM